AVPAAVLAGIADELATVHGQADQQRLKAPSRQRAALDDFAGPTHLGALVKYRQAWQQLAALRAEAADLSARTTERAREAELLRLGLAEIERVDPQPGEDARLTAVIGRLGNVETLRVAATTAYEALSSEAAGASPALDLLHAAERALDGAATEDPSLAALATRAKEATYLVSDLAVELSGYVDGLEADPHELEASHQRLAELRGLRAYGQTLEEVLAWASTAGLRLLDLDDGGGRLTALGEQIAALEQDLTARADALSATRRRAAEALGRAVTAELQGLAMSEARLSVVIEPAEPSVSGSDAVSFNLIPHRNAPPRPLGKGASGGELSRVMLAIEVALAEAGTTTEHLPTFVFDEVDAGVGGKAAVEVGRRLAKLAQRTQVIVVTHLAQVAAFADRQLVVTKAAGPDGAVTGVEVVDGERRTAELARMLSGQEDSAAALEHARELLATSQA
ncbi:MAG: DNA repair protein RecN, partial [Promicromonosporaceae bacterium]|nr:DNA repair protein RecN [Promicromonosporaceae bacterium]